LPNFTASSATWDAFTASPVTMMEPCSAEPASASALASAACAVPVAMMAGAVSIARMRATE